MFFLIIILACMLVRVIRKGLPEDDEPDDPNDPDKMTDEDIDTDAIDDAGDNVESNANEDIHANVFSTVSYLYQLGSESGLIAYTKITSSFSVTW